MKTKSQNFEKVKNVKYVNGVEKNKFKMLKRENIQESKTSTTSKTLYEISKYVRGIKLSRTIKSQK